MPGRILALDYGTKRIGVALSDELKWTAQPLETFERRALEWDIAHVAALVTAHDVERVVLGFPLQLDGREGPAVLAMREFAVKLETGISVPIGEWFRVEFRLARASTETGTVALYQDGVPVVEATEIVTDRFAFHRWYVGNWAENLNPPDSTVYVDDVTIRAEVGD